jgi:hypothetical protein
MLKPASRSVFCSRHLTLKTLKEKGSGEAKLRALQVSFSGRVYLGKLASILTFLWRPVGFRRVWGIGGFRCFGEVTFNELWPPKARWQKVAKHFVRSCV